MSDLVGAILFVVILAMIALSFKYCERKKVECVAINAMVTQCYDSKGERIKGERIKGERK